MTLIIDNILSAAHKKYRSSKKKYLTMKLHLPLSLIVVAWTCSISFVAEAKTTKLFAQNVGLLVDTRLDPLVNPNTCSSHVHSVYGNAGFRAKVGKHIYRDDDWQSNIEEKYNQTTSELIPNLSSYWVPSLYIWDEATQKYYLTPSFSRPYYRIEHTSDYNRLTVHPFPPYLRMIVGDAQRKEAWNEEETDRDNIRWTLTTYNRKGTNYLDNGDWSYLKEMDPTVFAAVLEVRGQVEMLLKFPNCLAVKKNGKPITRSDNFRDHASYTTNVWDETRGFCPPSHPYPIPRLDLETRYNLVPMRKLLGTDVVNNISNWRLSTGDASGAGGHADFISGWPSDMMTNIIANCTNGHSVNGRDCVLDNFELDGREGRAKEVPFTNHIPNEEVHQVSTLPGSNVSGECPAMIPAGEEIQI